MLLPTMLMLLQATTPATTPTPTPTPSSTPTPSPSPTPTVTPTPSTAPTLTALVPVCLSRQVKDSSGQFHRFVAVLRPADVVDALLSKGFTVAPCAAQRMTAAAYRDDACQFAAIPNDAVQNRYEQVFGIRASLQCEAAKGLGTMLETILGGGR